MTDNTSWTEPHSGYGHSTSVSYMHMTKLYRALAVLTQKMIMDFDILVWF